MGVYYVLSITAVAILITMSLAMIRAIAGPTVFDRVLALNMFGTKTVLLICVVCFIIKRTDFLDLALLYSLMNFIGMVALLRFSQFGGFSNVDEVAANGVASKEVASKEVASGNQSTSTTGGR